MFGEMRVIEEIASRVSASRQRRLYLVEEGAEIAAQCESYVQEELMRVAEGLHIELEVDERAKGIALGESRLEDEAH